MPLFGCTASPYTGPFKPEVALGLKPVSRLPSALSWATRPRETLLTVEKSPPSSTFPLGSSTTARTVPEAPLSPF